MDKKRELYLLLYVILLLCAIFIQLRHTQVEISIVVNGIHTELLDSICRFGTYIGDGFFALACAVIVSRFDPKLALGILLAYLLSAGITQLLKHTLFSNSSRPLAQFEEMKLIGYHVVDGIELNYRNSFPSGHTTSAFAFFSILAFDSKQLAFKILFLLIACFAAFTRVYLLQHFLVDTCAGSIIGVGSAILVNHFLNTRNGYELLRSKFVKQ